MESIGLSGNTKSKWTTDINLEMNYWQADAGDLNIRVQPQKAITLDGNLHRIAN